MGKTTEDLIAEDTDNGIPEELLPCEPDPRIAPYDDATEVNDPTAADTPVENTQ